MRSADITFVILTRNEAANLRACIASLPVDSHVLVYDAFSADSTPHVAQDLGARVIQAPWTGFAQAREAAIAHVQTPWTFMLDADERLTPALRAELDTLEPPDAVAGYTIARRNFYCGRWVKSGGWWPDRLVRLMRTGRAYMQAKGTGANSVHETWQLHGERGQLQSPIDHYSYPTVADYRRKFDLYTDLEAAGQAAGFAQVLRAWLLVPIRFTWFMLRRGGIFEGWRGAYVCGGSSLYPAIVASKSFARQRHPPSPSSK